MDSQTCRSSLLMPKKKCVALNRKKILRCVKDADSLCASENAPDSRCSLRRFTRPSHLLFLAFEMRNESKKFTL